MTCMASLCMSLPVPSLSMNILCTFASLSCHFVPTASQTAAVEIKIISAEQKWSLFRGCREASSFLNL